MSDAKYGGTMLDYCQKLMAGEVPIASVRPHHWHEYGTVRPGCVVKTGKGRGSPWCPARAQAPATGREPTPAPIDHRSMAQRHPKLGLKVERGKPPDTTHTPPPFYALSGPHHKNMFNSVSCSSRSWRFGANPGVRPAIRGRADDLRPSGRRGRRGIEAGDLDTIPTGLFSPIEGGIRGGDHLFGSAPVVRENGHP